MIAPRHRAYVRGLFFHLGAIIPLLFFLFFPVGAGLRPAPTMLFFGATPKLPVTAPVTACAIPNAKTGRT